MMVTRKQLARMLGTSLRTLERKLPELLSATKIRRESRIIGRATVHYYDHGQASRAWMKLHSPGVQFPNSCERCIPGNGACPKAASLRLIDVAPDSQAMHSEPIAARIRAWAERSAASMQVSADALFASVADEFGYDMVVARVVSCRKAIADSGPNHCLFFRQRQLNPS